MIDAMKQALEALEWHEEQDEEIRYNECPSRAAMTALRQAIAEAEKQEHFDGRILVRLRQAAWNKVGQEFKDDPECCFALGFDAGIDAVAPKVEPAVSQSGGGFESLPASPQTEKESTLQEISDIGREIEKEPVACECHRCIKENNLRDGAFPLSSTKMVLCHECGNKRCPKASDHRLACTGSNESGQAGSIYTAPPKRQWVGLTDNEIKKVFEADWNRPNCPEWLVEFSKKIEAKLREKNT